MLKKWGKKDARSKEFYVRKVKMWFPSQKKLFKRDTVFF